MKNILFLEEKFSMQGSTRALLDYAHFNEKILGNKSLLAFGSKDKSHPWQEPYYKNIQDNTFNSLKQRFPVLEYKDYYELENYIQTSDIDGMYHIKSGEPIGFHSKSTRNLIHAVFPQPIENVHGHKYAFVSKWLSDNCAQGKIPYVSHMVYKPKFNELEARKQIRESLNIPQDAMVYGRIGGYNDFDLPFVYESIKKALDIRKDLYFLQICTKPFYDHERVIYLDPIMDLKEKYRYIAATDAMIHARNHGETFGLAVAEFCSMNKPILTWSQSIGKGYVEILKEDGIYYNNENDLLELFLNFIPEKNKDYNSYKYFSPENIMTEFNNVFLT